SFIHRISFSVKPPALRASVLRGGRIRLCPGGVQALPNQGGALCAALRVGTYVSQGVSWVSQGGL
ncbi:TPA: hypothetical protein ACJVDT_001907, partial [Neisseria meningitidis]